MLRIDYEELEPSEDYLLELYQGQPFNGIAFELRQDGTLWTETSFKEGQKCGVSREWSPSGVLICEETLILNVLYGISKEWYDNGQPKSEGTYEFGICINKKEWDENGNLINDYTLDAKSPEFSTLEKFRNSNIGHLARRLHISNEE
jgi:antitoxin component YwqK of YwqJK toxin-antitoxin module